MKRSPTTAGLAAALLALGACSAAPSGIGGLAGELDRVGAQFGQALHENGLAGNVRVGVFVAAHGLHPRHRQNFVNELEGALRSAFSGSSIVVMSRPDRIFALVDNPPADWRVDAAVQTSQRELVTRFQVGEETGWVAANQFWAQYARLAIGDRTWLERLPESVRADLGTPLTHLLRVSVSGDGELGPLRVRSRLRFTLHRVGSEQGVLQREYEIVQAYSLS